MAGVSIGPCLANLRANVAAWQRADPVAEAAAAQAKDAVRAEVRWAPLGRRGAEAHLFVLARLKFAVDIPLGCGGGASSGLTMVPRGAGAAGSAGIWATASRGRDERRPDDARSCPCPRSVGRLLDGRRRRVRGRGRRRTRVMADPGSHCPGQRGIDRASSLWSMKCWSPQGPAWALGRPGDFPFLA